MFEWVVCVDHDGVQSRSHVSALAEFNRLMAERGIYQPLTYEDMVDWNTLQITAAYRLDPQTATQINAQCWFDSEVLAQAPPERGVLRALALLDHLPRARVHTVTTRKPIQLECTLAWNQRHAPWLGADRLHLRQTESVSGDDFKIAEARSLGASWFLEDNADTFDKLTKAGISTTLVSRPWNLLRRDLDPFRCQPEFWPILTRGLKRYTSALQSSRS